MEEPFWFYYMARCTDVKQRGLSELRIAERLELELPHALHAAGFLEPVYQFTSNHDNWLISVLISVRKGETTEPAQRAVQAALASAANSVQFIRCGSVPAYSSHRQPPRAA